MPVNTLSLESAYAQFEKVSASLPEENREAAKASITDAIQLFRGGDEIGGIAKTIEGVGSLSAIFSAAGPEGAAVGEALAVITKLIAAVLGLFRHEEAPPSLVEQIEHIIVREELTKEKELIVGVTSEWALYEDELLRRCSKAVDALAKKPPEPLPSFADLTTGVELAPIQGKIVTALTMLADKLEKNAEGWLPLLTSTLFLAERFWKSFQQIGGVVSDPQTFAAKRDIMARELLAPFERRGTVLGLWDGIQQNCRAFMLSTSHDLKTRNTVAAGWADHWQLIQDKKRAMAISSRGTLFCGGDNKKLYVGRTAEDLALPPGQDECHAVYIGEHAATATVLVVQLHADQRNLTFRTFNDGDCEAERKQGSFTANLAERWSKPFQLELPRYVSPDGHWACTFIRAGHISPLVGGKYRVLLYVQHGARGDQENDIENPNALFEGIYDPARPGLDMREVPHYGNEVGAYRVSNESIPEAETEGGVFLEHGTEIFYHYRYPFAVSLFKGRPAVQVGSKVMIQETAGVVTTLDLQSYVPGLGDAWVYQAAFYDDETFVCCAANGLFMGYLDVVPGCAPVRRWSVDDTIRPMNFTKLSAPVFPIFKAFYEVLKRFA